jgi:hypothetical protein
MLRPRHPPLFLVGLALLSARAVNLFTAEAGGAGRLHVPGPSTAATAVAVSPEDLLHRVARWLRYENQEIDFADSAAEVTANYLPGLRPNYLRARSGALIAAASYLGDPALQASGD